MHTTPHLSVNVNKVATLRNSRGGQVPRVLDAVDVCLRAGAAGITVHPRVDARHITTDDVREIARALEKARPGVEFNIEGDPRHDFMDLVLDVCPDQCTLVPVVAGEITSQKGWVEGPDAAQLSAAVARLKAQRIRVSLFVEPAADAIQFAASVGADRIELYTESFARAFERGEVEALGSFELYATAARYAHALGLGVNAGHDLDLQNLVLFRRLPHLAEVSIGHAIVSRALFVGLENVVREYLAVVAGASGRSTPPARVVD